MKLIISDMDGTILSHEIQEKICKETIDSINKLRDNKNIIFNIATGRHYANVLDLLEIYNINLNNNSFVIGMNGAQIYSIREKKLIHFDTLDKDEINKSNLVDGIYDEFKNDVIVFGYSTNNEIFFVDKKTETFEELKDHCCTYENITKSLSYKIISSINEIDGVFKFILFFPGNFDVHELKKKLEKKYSSFSFVKSGPNYLEVINPLVNKSTAIKYVNDNFFHLDKSDLISIGDSDNDLEMFAYTGTSYTREDADAHIRNSVTNVLPHLASYFVHYAIEEEIKKNKN